MFPRHTDTLEKQKCFGRDSPREREPVVQWETRIRKMNISVRPERSKGRINERRENPKSDATSVSWVNVGAGNMEKESINSL